MYRLLTANARKLIENILITFIIVGMSAGLLTLNMNNTICGNKMNNAEKNTPNPITILRDLLVT